MCFSCTGLKRPLNGRALRASFSNRASILKSLKGFEKVRKNNSKHSENKTN